MYYSLLCYFVVLYYCFSKMMKFSIPVILTKIISFTNKTPIQFVKTPVNLINKTIK